MEFESCLKKQEDLKNVFLACSTPESRYQKMIEMGRELPSFNPEAKISTNLVSGCQSVMHLEVTLVDGKLYFNAESEALISKGLAALLIQTYSGESPETVVRCPPSFISEIGLQHALSPARSNGLSSLYRKMQQEALKYLVISQGVEG